MENHDPNLKGNVAEMAIALEAMKLNLPVFKPQAEHGRTDLVIEIAGELKRVQSKWGRLSASGDLIVVQLSGSRLTPAGYVRSAYEHGEIDHVAVYCGELDRCYLLPQALSVGRSAVHLRLTPPKNGQKSCINLAADYEFKGAVAQLEERRHGMAEARGSSPLSSTSQLLSVGCDEFRIRLGYYVDLVLAGHEVFVTRRGKRPMRFALAKPA